MKAPIPSLDGLRGVAVLLVLAAHVIEAAKVRNVVPGSFGVTIFFFLSGYLITTLMRAEHEQTGTVAVGAFYFRRAVRILPPFYVVLGLATLATALGWLSNTLSPGAVVAQALHLTNYRIVLYGWWEGIAPGTFIFWSLAIEEHFYLVFPWLFLAVTRLARRERQAQVLLVLCAAALAWRCLLVFAFDATKDRVYPATDTRFDSILFGCVLALWGNPALDAPTLTDRAWKWALLPLSVAGLVASFVVRAPWFLETFRYTLQGVCLFAVFVVAVRSPSWGPVRALGWPPLRWVGRVSYSLYLVHPVVMEAIDARLPASLAPRAALSVLACLVVAAALHYAVEVPSGRLRRLMPRARPLEPAIALRPAAT